MTRRIKLLILAFSTLALTYCQSAPSGHRMFGVMGQVPLNQTNNAFTGVPSGGVPPNELLQAIINSRKQVTPEVTESPIPQIDYANEIDTKAACLGKGTVDTDQDGLPDDCDKEHFPHAYNGWIFGGRYFDPNNPMLDLTSEEESKWAEISKKYGGIYFSYMSPTSQKIFKKMESIRDPAIHSDLEPLKHGYYDLDGTPIRVSDLFKSYKRSDMFQEGEFDDKNIGVAAGDGYETPFYSRTTPAYSAYEMTGFGKDIYSLLEKNPKMVVWETHVVIPANVTHLQMAIAHAYNSTTGIRIKPTSALYTVINNNDTLLLKSKLLSNQSNRLIGREYAILSKNPGCITANLIITAQIDPTGQITPEIPVFRASDQDQWTTLSQEYFSIVPLGGAQCQQNFIDIAGKNNKSFFNTARNTTLRVPGAVDFNSSLNQQGTNNPRGTVNPSLLVDSNTQSLKNLDEGLKRLPIEKMDKHQVDEFLNSLSQIDPNTFENQEDKDWIQSKIDEAKARQQELADLEAEKNKPAPVTPAIDPKLVQFDSVDGCIDLTSEDIGTLNKLGFTVKNGEEVIAADSQVQTGKITVATLETILEQLKVKIESGPLTPDEASAILKFLESMKKNKCVDPALIDQFTNDHADRLCPNRWTPEQIALLKSLDETNEAKPGLTEEMRTWSNCFPDQAANDAAKKKALEKIEAALLDPSKKDFTTEERLAVVDDLLKTGFIDANKAEELKFKINARDAFVDSKGVYHPEYAFVISRVEIKVKGPDGSEKTVPAFKFNSVINFKLNSSDIDDNGRNVINGFIDFGRILIKQNPNWADSYFRVEAFADAKGPTDPKKLEAINQTITDMRAHTVRKYILNKTQVSEDHIEAVGKGTDPEALNGPKKNGKYLDDIRFRRVEILFSAEDLTPKTPL